MKKQTLQGLCAALTITLCPTVFAQCGTEDTNGWYFNKSGHAIKPNDIDTGRKCSLDQPCSNLSFTPELVKTISTKNNNAQFYLGGKSISFDAGFGNDPYVLSGKEGIFGCTRDFKTPANSADSNPDRIAYAHQFPLLLGEIEASGENKIDSITVWNNGRTYDRTGERYHYIGLYVVPAFSASGAAGASAQPKVTFSGGYLVANGSENVPAVIRGGSVLSFINKSKIDQPVGNGKKKCKIDVPMGMREQPYDPEVLFVVDSKNNINVGNAQCYYRSANLYDCQSHVLHSRKSSVTRAGSLATNCT